MNRVKKVAKKWQEQRAAALAAKAAEKAKQRKRKQGT